jgi:hypothetical protein
MLPIPLHYLAGSGGQSREGGCVPAPWEFLQEPFYFYIIFTISIHDYGPSGKYQVGSSESLFSKNGFMSGTSDSENEENGHHHHQNSNSNSNHLPSKKAFNFKQRKSRWVSEFMKRSFSIKSHSDEYRSCILSVGKFVDSLFSL